MRWSREVAEGFLQAVVSHNSPEAVARTTEAFRKRYAMPNETERDVASRLEMRVFGRQYDPTAEAAWEAVRFDEWALESEAMSPTEDEAVIKGALTGPNRRASFSLIVVKEGGKWRVDTFSVQNRGA